MLKTVKELRTVSLREMARKLSVSPSYLFDVENGKRIPSYALYERMLREYGEGIKNWYEVYTKPCVRLKMY